MTEPKTTHSSRRPRGRLAAMLAAAAFLGGCASFSPDGGFAPVQQTAKDRLGKDLQWARSDADRDAIDRRVRELLAKPLSVDDAVQIALLNNRGLQAEYHELGITEADLVQAGRLPNPGVAFARKTQGGEVEIEWLLAVNLARLAAMPLVMEVESRRFAQTQLRVSLQMLSLAADTRKAYVHALAAEESVRYMRQVMQAAEASAELARRMEQVGNVSKLQRAREQGFYADAALNLARAEQTQRATRERLTRLLGLWGAQAAFTLPERLPDLPKSVVDLPDLEGLALEQRLDVRGAKLAAEQTAKNLGLMRTTRFINVLEVGAIYNTFNDAPSQRGYEIAFELPLFDWGDARMARAEAIYMQAVDRAAQTAIDARSEVREAYTGYRSAWDIARHQRDEIVPVRRRIAEENLLRYNGMLIGVFDLLADARAQIASVNGYIEALRDFWIAQADLDMALIGKPSLATPAGPVAAAESGSAGH
ncbi:MAG TPA: TolC family protein [Rubrivivax sp.]|nr:TolC family protein [Rubrivivax sp.]HPO20433.1 TolC family protein [Rubrivivax sp.]